MSTLYGYPLEIQTLLQALRDTLEKDADDEQYEAFFNLTAALLRRAHSVDSDAAAELLMVKREMLPRLIDEVFAAILSELDQSTEACTHPTSYPHV